MPYKNLLLIDDDEDDHEIFRCALQDVSVDINFHTLGSAREALQKLTANEIGTDVIFLDMNMPVMNGVQFLQEIKKVGQLCNIPIIVFSTSSNERTIKEAMDAGADNFITKPDKFNELVNILRTIIL